MRNLHNTFERKKKLKLFSILTMVLLVLLFAVLVKEGKGTHPIPPVITPATDPFDGITLTAKAAYVYDLRTKTVLYAKNENARLPLASVTKVMTALVASNLASPNDTITVSAAAIKTDGDSGLLVGEHWKLRNLLDFSLTSSSNDGMNAIAYDLGSKITHSNDAKTDEAAFVAAMNAEADTLQMKNTYYLNATGLDISKTEAGAYGSAADMAKLVEYILASHPDLLEATQESVVTVSSQTEVHTAINTDVLADNIPGMKASKTGYTDLAGGNLVVAFDPELDHPIIISVLGSTENGRFADMTNLVNAALRSVQLDRNL